MPVHLIRRFLIALVITASSSLLFAHAALNKGVTKQSAAPDADPEVATIYRGKRGDDRVQLTLRAKPDEPGGFSGHYFVFGGGRNLMLAGEVEGDELYMEESDDGVNISGDWEGQFVVEDGRAYIVGTWYGLDEEQSKPFKLEPVLRSRAYRNQLSGDQSSRFTEEPG